MIGDTHTLSATEQRIAIWLSKMRYQAARNAGVTDKKVGNQSNEDTDLEGIASEMAFCRMFNLYPDLSVGARSASQGDENGDARLHCGSVVDVKTTKYSSGRLIAAKWKGANNNIDYYALMVGEFPTYTFRGFMDSSELMKQDRLGKLPGQINECHMAKQYELTDAPQCASVRLNTPNVREVHEKYTNERTK